MDFAQAKIHSLVMIREGSDGGTGSRSASVTEDDPVTMRFKEVEARFLQQFNMPKQEKLVNCTFLRMYHTYVYLLFVIIITIGKLHCSTTSCAMHT